jgi:hypothetical protein
VAPLAIVAATLVSYAVGWAVKIPALVPLLNTAASFPFMLAALRRGDLRLAVARMLVWAAAMGACATLLAYLRPWEAGTLFVNGARYREEMFTWVMTGRGAESSPAQFIPQHARDAAIFSALTLVSGGVASMPMGAALMNYMGTYVGSLAAASRHPALTLLAAWHPWAVIRVVSFVVIGVVLSVPLLSVLLKYPLDRRTSRLLMAWALAGLFVDVGLKALLAPAWHRLLLQLAGW